MHLNVGRDLMTPLNFQKYAVIHLYVQLKENKLSIPIVIHISQKELGL